MNPMRTILASLFLLALFMAVYSCVNNKKTLPEPDEAIPINGIPITYTSHAKAIIDAKCISCHQPGGQFPSLTVYDDPGSTIDDVKGQLLDIESTTIDNNFPAMPAPPDALLTQDLKDTLQMWIDQGGLE